MEEFVNKLVERVGVDRELEAVGAVVPLEVAAREPAVHFVRGRDGNRGHDGGDAFLVAASNGFFSGSNVRFGGGVGNVHAASGCESDESEAAENQGLVHVVFLPLL